jgi:hypothetical protein
MLGASVLVWLALNEDPTVEFKSTADAKIMGQQNRWVSS